MTGLTVAVIHATPAAVAPAAAAFREGFPEAELWNLLDDRLAGDADRAGRLVPPLRRRMLSLIWHAVDGGARAVQLSCSMYGPVARLAAELWDLPVLSSDEQMFREVARRRPARLGVLGSLETAVADSARRLLAEPDTPKAEVVPITAPDAAADRGDQGRRLAALEAAAKPHAGDVELLLLAQYSLSPLQQDLEASLRVPVLSPPLLAARELRRRLLGTVPE